MVKEQGSDIHAKTVTTTYVKVHLCVCVCVCVCVFVPAVGDDVAVTLLKGQFYRVIRVIKIKQKKSLLS